jgi:hypothetical protein
VQFYTVRQYVVYQKESVVLSPPTQYAPGSPEAQTFVGRVQPATDQLGEYEKKNPIVKTAPVPFSRLENKPKVIRPMALRPPRGAPGGRTMGVHAPGSPAHGLRRPRNNGGASEFHPRKKKKVF